MKTKHQPVHYALLLALLLLPGLAHGMTNAFTYQGRLTDGGSVANGSYDLTFTLFTEATGGTPLGDGLTNLAVNVSGGLFTVSLDFSHLGGAAFEGGDRWLEIAGRTNGVGGFGTLTPRQLITPTPYALRANSAGSADSASITGTANNFSGSLAGNVTGTQGATVVATVGGQSAANVASGATAANAATNASIPNTIVKRGSNGYVSLALNGSSLIAGHSASAIVVGAEAANAATNANTANTIVKRNPSGDFSANTITANLIGNVSGNAITATTATTAATANDFSGSLAGEVTGTQGATVVAAVGGQSAADIASGAVAANAATTANVANSIVKRDGAGNFTATTANNFSGLLVGNVTGTQGATLVATVGGVSAANVASGANAANAAASANTASTIVKRDGSGNFTAGDISLTSATTSGGVSVGGMFRLVPSSVFVIGSSTTLTPTTSFVNVGANSGDVTLNTTTAIADGGASGEILVLKGSGLFTVTVRDGANTKLGAVSRALSSGDTLTLIWDGNDWTELSFADN